MVGHSWVSLLPCLYPRQGTAEASHLEPPTGTTSRGPRKVCFLQPKDQKMDCLTTKNCFGSNFPALVKLQQKNHSPTTEPRGTKLAPHHQKAPQSPCQGDQQRLANSWASYPHPSKSMRPNMVVQGRAPLPPNHAGHQWDPVWSWASTFSWQQGDRTSWYQTAQSAFPLPSISRAQ